jgi:hypothetical protein
MNVTAFETTVNQNANQMTTLERLLPADFRRAIVAVNTDDLR